MVSVREKVEVSATEFFNEIIKGIKYDIQTSTGKNVDDVREGYAYKKVMKNKLKRSGEVGVEILELKKDESYVAKFDSIQGITTISYRLEPISDKETIINYFETYVGHTKLNDINFKFVQLIYKNKAKKRMIKLIHAIENYILTK